MSLRSVTQNTTYLYMVSKADLCWTFPTRIGRATFYFASLRDRKRIICLWYLLLLAVLVMSRLHFLVQSVCYLYKCSVLLRPLTLDYRIGTFVLLLILVCQSFAVGAQKAWSVNHVRETVNTACQFPSISVAPNDSRLYSSTQAEKHMRPVSRFSIYRIVHERRQLRRLFKQENCNAVCQHIFSSSDR